MLNLCQLLLLLRLQLSNLRALVGLSRLLLLLKPCHFCLLSGNRGLHGPLLFSNPLPLFFCSTVSSPLPPPGFLFVVPVVPPYTHGSDSNVDARALAHGRGTRSNLQRALGLVLLLGRNGG